MMYPPDIAFWWFTGMMGWMWIWLWFWFVFIIFSYAFWLWMFVDSLKKRDVLWIILFLFSFFTGFLSGVLALIYYFLVYSAKRRHTFKKKKSW